MKKKLKQIYIYRDSHLPESGWLQSCFKCCSITSNVILFETVRTNSKYILWEFYIHTCPKCVKILKIDDNENKQFKYECNEYIWENYGELYKQLLNEKKNIAASTIQKWWNKIIELNEISL